MMKKTLQTAALMSALALPGAVSGSAFSYTSGDLLLSWHGPVGGGYDDVVFNLGAVTNYLGKAAGTTWTVTNWNSAVVASAYAGVLPLARFSLAAEQPGSAWISFYAANSAAEKVPVTDSPSGLSTLVGLIRGVGLNAASSATNTYFRVSSGNVYSYTLTVGGSSPEDPTFPLHPLATYGSAHVGFNVEGKQGSSVSLYQRNASSYPFPPATLIGTFTLDSRATNLTFRAGALAPTVATVSPASVVANYGDSATFSVSSDGTLPLTYQWNFAGGPLGGKTNASLTVSAAGTSQGDYTVKVSNGGGNVTSSAGNLTVIPPTPTLASAPTRSGSDVVVSVQNSLPGFTYYLLSATNILTETIDWTVVGAPVPGTGAALPLTDPAPVEPVKFYQVLAQ